MTVLDSLSRLALPLPRPRAHADRSAWPVPTSSHAADVARAIAVRRDLWAPHVRFDPLAAHRATVWADDRWEVELGAWLPGQASPERQHVGAPGALLVLQGSLRETTWVLATDGPTPGRRHSVTRTFTVDDVRSHGPVHVHAVGNDGADPAVALHVRSRS